VARSELARCRWSPPKQPFSRMQCGCVCTKCENDLGNVVEGVEECRIVDADGVRCLERSCGVQFSSGAEAPFCAVEVPSRWPPLFDTSYGLIADETFDYAYDYESNGLDDDGNVSSYKPVWERDQKWSVLYTAANWRFANAAMQHFARGPDLAALAQPQVQAQITVRISSCEPVCLRSCACMHTTVARVGRLCFFSACERFPLPCAVLASCCAVHALL
jgi:hypothetical protein